MSLDTNTKIHYTRTKIKIIQTYVNSAMTGFSKGIPTSLNDWNQHSPGDAHSFDGGTEIKNSKRRRRDIPLNSAALNERI